MPGPCNTVGERRNATDEVLREEDIYRNVEGWGVPLGVAAMRFSVQLSFVGPALQLREAMTCGAVVTVYMYVRTLDKRCCTCSGVG